MSDEKEVCQFCQKVEFRYTCPKCNALYCSVACYKSQQHLKCSEDFYKSCIQDELNAATPNSREDMQKIYDILKRIRESDEGINPGDFDADGLDDPLDSDDNEPVSGGESPDEDEEDIATRLQGIDINNSEQVWQRLTPAEQKEFQELIETGEIIKLVPDYTPWWVTKRNNSKIVVLSSSNEANDSKNPKPKVWPSIANFSEICKKTPSPCLHYNLWNILAAYACTVRFFSGEHLTNPSEATAQLVNLSSTLKYNTNFEDAEDSIISVEMEALTTGNSATGQTIVSKLVVENRKQLQEDARQLMSTQESKLAALSDILQLMLMTKQQQKKAKFEQAEFQKLFALCSGSAEVNRSKLQQLIKKLEFLLAYVNKED